MRKFFSIALLLVLVVAFISIGSCEPDIGNPDESYYEMTAQEFKNYAPANETISYDDVDYYLLNAAIFHDTNIIRQENSVGLLEYSKALERAAQTHSIDMIEQDFFAHDNPNTGKDPFDRMADEGVTGGYRGENIACASWRTWTYNTLAEQFVHNQWWNSAGHRANMLNGNFTYLGVGSYTGTTTFMSDTYDTVVGTQNFGSVVPE